MEERTLFELTVELVAVAGGVADLAQVLRAPVLAAVHATSPVGHQHGRKEGGVGVLDLDKPRTVGDLLPVELDVDPVPPGVVGDEVRLELFLGDCVYMAGHSAPIDNYLQVSKSGASSVN